MNRCFVLLAIIITLTGCAQPASDHTLSTNPFPETVFYQIYTRAFCDSDGDGIGDLNGITSKLDYLQDLGIGALWIMPLFEAPTVHKYFAADFMKVDPEYGTEEDLKRLVQETHKRNIKVLIDFSINHSSYYHPWFQQSIGADSGTHYRKLYHWKTDRMEYNPENHNVKGLIDTAFNVNYKKVHPDRQDEESQWYYARFLDAPDFNYDNKEVRDYMLNVGRFWLGEVGVDGLRLDAARHVYDIESTHPVYEGDRNYIWWSEFCIEMKKIRPDAFLLGEIWSSMKVMGSYLGLGMDAVFNFQFSSAMQKSVLEEKNIGLTRELMDMHEHYRGQREDFGDATFLINHDMPRLMDAMEFNENKVRLAVSILMTYPGSPFIYYGEELGYRANRWLVWLPMLWDDPISDPGIPQWMFDDSISQTLISPPPLDALKGIEPFTEQMTSKGSLYWHYRSMIHIRSEHELLNSGGLEQSDLSSEEIVAFFRTGARDSILVLHNLTPHLTTLSTVDSPRGFNELIYSSNGASINGNRKIMLPAYASLILGKAKSE